MACDSRWTLSIFICYSAENYPTLVVLGNILLFFLKLENVEKEAEKSQKYFKLTDRRTAQA